MVERALTFCLVALALTSVPIARAQDSPSDIKIIPPLVNKTDQSVSLPAAFWNEHAADWIEVALSGRPSDFSHETLVTATTTRSLLEDALRQIGCRDGNAWADGIRDFARLRGDQFIILATFEQDGKKQTWSLDELISFSHWNVSLGPYGFMFKGDPDRAGAVGAAGAASRPTAPLPVPDRSTDATRILRDDPQIALIFKGLQARSQSFADHPLAYVEDRWPFEEIDRGRNHAPGSGLPAAILDSNGKIPVTLTFKRVSAEELITQNAAVWHDDPFKQYMLAQIDTAQRIDSSKARYLALRQGSPADRAAHADELASLLAGIEADYAILDDAWTRWAVDHLHPDAVDDAGNAFVRDQALRWAKFIALNKDRTQDLSDAAAATASIHALPQPPDPRAAAALQGRIIQAQSRALVAENSQPQEYWQKQFAKIPEPKPNDVWTQDVTLHLAQIDARLKSANAGIAYGSALAAPETAPAQLAALKSALEATVKQMNLADAKLALANVDFEISKRSDTPDDPDLPDLKKQHDALTAQIKDLGG